ncbi:MAG: V-type ATP synthase subunit K [Actinomycetota bacterium]|nr:V-type ATP synthase subunit K [Actinomycetota bacterium]MDD5666482.1 V-type ATP synthase subunit K [Actinomycetota bacterium]
MVEAFGGLSGLHWALLGAAVAVIGGGAGSGMGITYVANVAGGILTEMPERFGPLLPLVVIPGTQGIYGFITGVLVIFIMEPSAGWAALPGALGFQIFLACLPVAFVCFVTGAYQGLTAAGAAGMVAKRREEMGRSLVLPALVETYAVLSLIVTILMFFIVISPEISKLAS